MINKGLNPSAIVMAKLARVFENTTTTYKYFWFLSLLRFIKRRRKSIAQADLINEMFKLAWHPTVYYKLSFGKQDQMQRVILQVQEELNIADGIGGEELDKLLKAQSANKALQDAAKMLGRYVPTRFIAPWFSNALKGVKDAKKDRMIIDLARECQSGSSGQSPIYWISEDSEIVFNPEWFDYLSANLKIVEGFAFWELINFLHQRNPNTPNIAAKLEAPAKRNLQLATKYWRAYYEACGGLKCIYTEQVLELEDFSIDHFLPWSYVAHDQLWNLVPTSKSVNSSKSNALPSTQYKERFTELQYHAISFWLSDPKKSRSILEDYSLLFKLSLKEIEALELEQFKNILWSNIAPQIQVAANMGFSANWIFRQNWWFKNPDQLKPSCDFSQLFFLYA